MEPIPETVEAVEALENLGASSDGHLLAEITRLAGRAKQIVPDLVGVSITPLDEGLTFTLVATTPEVAILDAIQYVAGGPCVEGAHTEQVIQFEPDVLDEERWRLFAEATAARAVRSTLTLPVLSAGRVAGTVNLYAASPRAFGGHHEQLGEVFGAWAAGAVANADLAFATRSEAQAAPQKARDQHLIDVAAGIVAAELGISVGTAKARLREAASRAGVSLVHVAREIVGVRDQRDPGDG